MDVDTAPEGLVIRFSVADAKIAEMRDRFSGLEANDPKGYDEVRRAIAVTREHRVGVEKTRKTLKADALDYGRRVDAEAKRLTGLLVEIEKPLQEKKDAVDQEKARIKAEKEAAERARVEAEITAKREAEEARLKALRDAEEARIAEERKAMEAEREKIAAQRAEEEAAKRAELAKIEAAQKAERERMEARQREIEEQQRIEREKLEEQRRKIEAQQAAERERLEAKQREIEQQREEANRIERERIAAIAREVEEKRRAHEEKLEAERLARELAERVEAERLRLEALRPDVEKIHSLAGVLRGLKLPDVTTTEAVEFLDGIKEGLLAAAEACEFFCDEVAQ